QHVDQLARDEVMDTLLKSEEGIHHVEESVHHFIARELIDVLAASKGWNMSASVAIGHLSLATNRIRTELCCPALAGDSILLDFEHRGGYLLAGIARPGWIASLDEGQRATLCDALAGLYKKAGV